MGYRLDVTDLGNNNNYYGTKHYGYLKESTSGEPGERQLESYKYLVSIGKFNGKELFEYGCENPCELTAEQFKKFIELYNKEYLSGISWETSHNILEEKRMSEIYDSPNRKRIKWL